MLARDSRFWLFFVITLAAGVGSAGATTLTVAAGGLDADGCGPKAAPCRSISRAIFNAAPGDKIVVGPGRYGDLDADGTFGEPGEETGSSNAVVRIDKTLTVESVEGAATTLIDAGGANLITVRISANGVLFGKAKKGFTLARSGVFGVLVDVDSAGVVVSGVRAVNNRTGFASKGPVVVRNSVAEANDENGFSLGGPGSIVTGCRATGNTLSGFAIGGNGSVLKTNVATANGEAGFDLQGDAIALTGSVAAGNALGLRVGEGSGYTLTGNSFLGNASTGALVISSDVTITKSNIFGNGSGGTNCGVTTAGGGAVTLDKVCFGAPSGPGDDPADAICGAIAVQEIVEKVIKIVPKVPL